MTLAWSIATLSSAPTTAADVVRFGPGPNGSMRITTPWGEFLAVEMGDEIWVGTEREWNNVISDNVARDHGFKRIRAAGEKPNERNYALAGLPSATVGASRLNGITTSIVFGVPSSRALNRPPKPKGAEYVSVSWTPSDGAAVRAVIYTGGASVSPNECATVSGFRYCEFTLTKGQLIAPADMVFLARGAKPAVVPVESIARRSHADIVLKYKSMPDISVSVDDISDTARLHDLDASIPAAVGP